MHLLSADCLGSLFLLLPTFFGQVSGLETVMGLYDQTLEIPCNKGAVKAEDALITKWKYDKGDGLSGDLLVRKKTESVSINTTDEYKGRINMAANSSLLLSALKLSDQRTFTCMVVVGLDIDEYPVNVVVYKAPAGVEVSDKAQELAIGKLTKLATCITKDANPAANITWLKNNKPLVDGGKGVSIRASVQVDPVSGLSSTSSTLEYSATKEDTDARFSCSAQHIVGKELASSALTFTITYSTENIVLQVIAPEPLVEGDNVTLKCMADGNPAPTSFNFHVKGDVIPVKNMDTYTLTHVSRDDTGEYQCSLIDNSAMMASKDVTVNYLDIKLSPTGSVVKPAGEALELSFQINSSGQSKVSWTKDNVKLDKEPTFTELKYSDSGRYESDVKMGALSKKVFFDLVVEGAPVIKQLSKQRSEDGQHKVLICEAEGSPKPSVSWSINGTLLEESPFLNGKVTHKITVVPTINLTVSCTVSNEFGEDTWTIDVSSHESEDVDQTKLVVGVVVGLFIATVVIGLAYGICQKKSKQGSWKTGEKENGSSDEERKLEEKVEENSQKAEV
ncbi:CD166 antigen homolog A-like isoform X2 [Hippocampus zosterae]|uniref:CD166 antigen homolog A-like isoform X2 n=1 Tax=Hippocampus zosterae TaxID=109293 RepID=UPI00223E2CB2|nr:CD166 antigen homolog A-like isoform X2 [Hippocampus zosterae]